MLGTPGIAQLLIVGLIVLLLFGNRLPSVMRSLGEGITEFKKGIRSEDSTDKLEDRTADHSLDAPHGEDRATREAQREEVVAN